MTQSTEQPANRIVVALDASRYSLTALQAAAELAALMQAELQGVFVEDINLIRLCGLPFSHEIGAYSATRRRLDDQTVEREFRILAAQMRRAVAQAAVTAKVNWSFQVIRGAVTAEILAASESANLTTLGRVGRSLGKQLGSTAAGVMRQSRHPVFLLGEQGLVYPLTVLYSGSEAAGRALDFALLLSRERSLLVLLPAPEQAPAGWRAETEAALRAKAEAAGAEIEIRVLAGISDLRTETQQAPGTLVLPLEHAAVLEQSVLSAILIP